MALKKDCLILILLVALGSAQANAFASSCSSQGAWTTDALGGLNQLRQAIDKLKGDTKCDALSKSLSNAIAESDKALKSLAEEKGGGRQTSLLNLPKEIGALKDFYTSSRSTGGASGFDKMIMNMMAAKAVNYAAGMSKVSEVKDDDNSSETQLQTLSNRLRAASDTSLVSMMAFIEELPKNSECVYGNTGGSAMFGGLINVMAAFANAGPNSVGPKMAETVNKLAIYLRDNRYAFANQLLNTAEFQNSMACLLESTSEAYCTARDANYSLLRGRNILLEQQLKGYTLDKSSNPLNGYFILSHALPIVTDWLLKVQLGVQPRTTKDSEFKKDVMNTVQAFFNSVYDLQGKLSEQIQTIKSYSNQESKALAIIDLIQSLTAEMQMNYTKTNFFTQGRLSTKLAFEIAGLTENLPEVVFSTDKSIARKMSWDEWFRTPDGLAAIKSKMGTDSRYLEEIGNNVDSIVKDATRNAIAYYGTWFIVDEGHLVSESLNGVNYSVRDSLILIFNYLDGFSKRAGSDSRMGLMMSNVYDTMRRLQKVLIEYDKANFFYKTEVQPFVNALEQENRRRYKLSDSTPGYFTFLGGVKGSCKASDEKCTLETQLSDKKMAEIFHKVAEFNSKIINTIYDELNVLLSRSSFLSNRLAVFVEADFLNQIRSNSDMSLFEKDFYIATGVANYDALMSNFNKNPDAAKKDLAQAMVLHKSTLEALETLFKNSMVQHIARLKRISNNQSVSPNAIAVDSVGRLLRDSDPAGDRPSGTQAERSILAKERISLDPFAQIGRLAGQLGGSTVKKLFQSDRYEMPFETPGVYERNSSPTDEFNSHKEIYQKICIQALAFNDQEVFSENCSGVVMRSVLTPAQSQAVDPKVRRYLDRAVVSWLAKQSEGRERHEIKDENMWKAYNHSVRICAYRDFLRNSRVLSLTSAQNVSRFDPEKTKQVEEMVETLIQSDREAAEAEKKRREEAEAQAKVLENEAPAAMNRPRLRPPTPPNMPQSRQALESK